MLDKNTLPEIEKEATNRPNHSDRIPIACHYNPETLISKDGHLIQIIEVTGFAESGFVEGQTDDIRTALKEAIHSSIPDHSYSLHLSTIRSKKNLIPKGQLQFGLASELNETWNRKNSWDKQLTNSLYISVIKQGLKFSIFNPANFIKSLIPGQVAREHIKFFEKASLELTQVTNQLMSDLANFGARKLNMLLTDKGYLSEPLFFYYSIVHLGQYRTPLPVKDLSDYIGNVNISFGFNHVEIRSKDHCRYSAMFSLKEQPELNERAIDLFLQVGIEFIVSQPLIFVDKETAQEGYKRLSTLHTCSKTTSLRNISGLSKFIDSATGKAADYAKQLTTIMIYSEDKESFDINIKHAVKIFKELGMIVVREDYNMPRLFWSQLPGNFKFMSRFNYKSHNTYGEFSCIHSHKSGNYKGSRWGPPVSLIRQNDGTLFFFNFHNNHGNGNTVIIGPHGSGKTTLMRFLLSQSGRFNPRVLYIELENSAENFITSTGGAYYKISEDENEPPLFKLNPFDLRAFKGNKESMRNWLIKAIYPRAHASEEYMELFNVITDKILEEPEGTDLITMVEQIIENSKDQHLIDGLKSFYKTQRFKNYFTSDNDDLEIFDRNNIIGISLTELKQRPVELHSFLSILVAKLVRHLDGKPTIIAFNGFSTIYEIDSISNIFADLLNDARRKNAMFLVGTSKIGKKCPANEKFYNDLKLFGTQIFLSDKLADKYFKRSFDLTDDELFKVKSHNSKKRNFLLKQGDLSLSMSVKLDEFEDLVKKLNS